MNTDFYDPRLVRFIRTCIFFTLLSGLSLSSVSAQGIEVPDLETEIRNSGNTVPSSAIPALPPPVVPALPAAPTVAPQPVAPPVASPAVVAPEPVQPQAETAEKKRSVRGYALVGAGSPGSIFADLAVEKDPDFFVRFTHDAADGYSGEGTGNGFFDRATALEFSIGTDSTNDTRDARDTESSVASWFIYGKLGERTNGLQGLSTSVYSLTRRYAEWDAYAVRPFAEESPFAMAFGISGTVFSSFADQPGGAPPLAAMMEQANGYSLDPTFGFRWTGDLWSAGADASYRYDTAGDTGELHTGRATIYLVRAFNKNSSASVSADSGNEAFGSDLRFSAGILSDSASDMESTAVPTFEVSFNRNIPESFVSALTISAGLDAGASDPRLLALADPFVDQRGLPVNYADWMALASISRSQSDSLTLGADVSFRKTAFGRGILVAGPLTAEAITDARIPVVYLDRDSLETVARASYTAGFVTFTGAWTAEWLDALYRDSLHELSSTVTLADPDERKLWETSATASVRPDNFELPALGVSGMVRPFQALAITLSLEDILALVSGEERTLNDLFITRSGALVLSARIDF
jgi:hypothetical protein